MISPISGHFAPAFLPTYALGQLVYLGGVGRFPRKVKRPSHTTQSGTSPGSIPGVTIFFGRGGAVGEFPEFLFEVAGDKGLVGEGFDGTGFEGGLRGTGLLVIDLGGSAFGGTGLSGTGLVGGAFVGNEGPPCLEGGGGAVVEDGPLCLEGGGGGAIVDDVGTGSGRPASECLWGGGGAAIGGGVFTDGGFPGSCGKALPGARGGADCFLGGDLDFDRNFPSWCRFGNGGAMCDREGTGGDTDLF
mmetsp:Transcript_22591/g.39943  ORF Transcript_22591/g.39943 Transcript_22591/m.39943 type:complete len:245 (-) Transcript_22591:218-952(-)